MYIYKIFKIHFKIGPVCLIFCGDYHMYIGIITYILENYV